MGNVEIVKELFVKEFMKLPYSKNVPAFEKSLIVKVIVPEV